MSGRGSSLVLRGSKASPAGVSSGVHAAVLCSRCNGSTVTRKDQGCVASPPGSAVLVSRVTLTALPPAQATQ